MLKTNPIFRYSAALFAAVLTLQAASCKKKDAAQSMTDIHAQDGQPVDTRVLKSEDFSVRLKYPTVLYSDSHSPVYSSIDDVVRKINASIGSAVKRDQVIINFSDDYPALLQAEVDFQNAETSFKRSDALFKTADISKSDYDTARHQYESMRTALKTARDLVYVRSPIDGKITEIKVRVTEHISVGDHLFTVSGGGGFKAQFYVNPEEIDKIKTGERAFIDTGAVDANKKPVLIEGRVTQVALLMDSTYQAFLTEAFFDTDDKSIVDGMEVDIEVEVYRNENAIVVSQTELTESDKGWTAYTVSGDTAKAVQVQVGQSEGLDFEIINGLKAGDTLITDGLNFISDGTKVKPAADTNAANANTTGTASANAASADTTDTTSANAADTSAAGASGADSNTGGAGANTTGAADNSTSNTSAAGANTAAPAKAASN